NKLNDGVSGGWENDGKTLPIPVRFKVRRFIYLARSNFHRLNRLQEIHEAPRLAVLVRTPKIHRERFIDRCQNNDAAKHNGIPDAKEHEAALRRHFPLLM